MTAREVNFDGLVGPTHNYAGLALGNLASLANRGQVSSPRAAVLQGLAKMRRLTELGLPQALLPPQERPDVATLRRLGFGGNDHAVIESAARRAPALLAACSSAASMWVANAATVSPSADTADSRVHFTPANLASSFHRRLEPQTTAQLLRVLFPDQNHFVHHEPLPGGIHFGDEGAANHTRLGHDPGVSGVELFVYGRSAATDALPGHFPTRQTRAASEAITRLHGLAEERVVFAQQHPAAIDAGVFHNDVIAVGNDELLFCHQRSWLDQAQVLDQLQRRASGWLQVIQVTEDDVSLDEAVQTYLFNSQLVTLPYGGMALIVPAECAARPRVKAYLDGLLAADNPVREVCYLNLRESMRNGGGPACLRLRVVLTETELAAINPAVFLDNARYEQLVAWVDRHYRDRLAPADLADPKLLTECRTALDELTQLLKLGPVYPFQRSG